MFNLMYICEIREVTMLCRFVEINQRPFEIN